jgi:hypothetical protein
MVRDLLCTLQSGIGSEPFCERGQLDGITVHKLLEIIILIIMDGLFIFEVDRETIDRRLFLMHGKLHDVPTTLCRANVTRTYVIDYLIDVLSHSHSGMIVNLVYVLVNVLYGLYGGADLNIDVAIIPGGEIGIIRNDIAVVKGLASGVCICPAIVRPGIFWIAIFTKACLWTKLFGKTLATFAIDHVRCIIIFRTAGTMHHALCHGGIEHGMSFRVRDLSRDNGVDMSSISGSCTAASKR